MPCTRDKAHQYPLLMEKIANITFSPTTSHLSPAFILDIDLLRQQYLCKEEYLSSHSYSKSTLSAHVTSLYRFNSLYWRLLKRNDLDTFLVLISPFLFAASNATVTLSCYQRYLKAIIGCPDVVDIVPVVTHREKISPFRKTEEIEEPRSTSVHPTPCIFLPCVTTYL